jgi:hypothetical protein
MDYSKHSKLNTLKNLVLKYYINKKINNKQKAYIYKADISQHLYDL